MTPKRASHTGRHPVYFGALDGFRGVLAICVAIFHTFWYTHINDTPFFHNGPVIIDLFFVFSGFLMFRLYHNRLSTPQQASQFLKRRFARLYPIHIFMLGVFTAFACVRLWAHHAGLSVQEPGEIVPFAPGSLDSLYNIITHLTMTHSMGVTNGLSFNPPSWTISTEFFAYFIFILMFLRCPPSRVWHFCVITLIIGLTYYVLSRLKPNMDITYDLGFFRCLAGFFTGVVASWVFGRITQSALRAAVMPRGLPTVLECIALGAFVCFVIYMPGKLQFFIAPFAFIFVLVFAFDGGLVSRFMGNRVFRYLAKISYSVYMIHAIFAVTFHMIGSRVFPDIMIPGTGAGDLFLLVYLAIVIGSSHLTYIYIERPGQKWIEAADLSRLWKRRRTSAQ